MRVTATAPPAAAARRRRRRRKGEEECDEGMMARAGLFSFSLALPRPPSCLWVGGWCVCVWWMKAAAATWGGSRESSGLWSSSPPLSSRDPPLGFRRQQATQSVCVGGCGIGHIPHTPHKTTLPSFHSPFHLLSISPPPFSGSFPPSSSVRKEKTKSPAASCSSFRRGWVGRRNHLFPHLVAWEDKGVWMSLPVAVGLPHVHPGLC